MDQPPAKEETQTVICAGPLRRGPNRRGGHSQEDGVGGGAVFASGTDGNLSHDEFRAAGASRPLAFQRTVSRAV
jgi:hypothetical protein